MTVIEERGCLSPIQNNSGLAQGPFRVSGGWSLTSAPGRWVRRTIGRLIMKTQYTVLVSGVAAVLIALGFGVWAAVPIKALVPSTGQGIEPFQLMMNAKGLPSEEFADYTFLF
jgi:hypothetical protein